MTYKMIKDDDLAPMNNQYLDINPHSHPHTAYEALCRADAELTAKDAEIARLDDVISDCWAAVVVGASPESALLRVHAIIRGHFQSKDAGES